MTTEPIPDPMSEAEVHAFAAKAQAWWDQLTPKEQTLVRGFGQAVDPDGDDVRGYGDLEYAAYQLFFQGNAIPALSLAMNAWLSPAPAPPPPGPGGAGGTTGTRTMLN